MLPMNRQPQTITASQAWDEWKNWDCIIDVRSPDEFFADHFTGAINLPVLDNEQRKTIGTLHKHHRFEARRQGAAMVAKNIATHLGNQPLAQLAANATVLVYCWRGGNRSGAMATILARIGWKTAVVEGGYKALRAAMLLRLETCARGLQYKVLAGRTGVGKSLILQALAAQGAQVLDLEVLAAHRGSVLGRLPETAQPPQRLFESRLFAALSGFDSNRSVFVESESRKVGQIHVPAALIETMRASECFVIQADLSVRVDLLSEQYRFFMAQPKILFEQLDCLTSLHGQALINQWKQLASTQQWEAFIAQLLQTHYDPSYDRSMQRNYRQIESARSFVLQSADQSALVSLATALINAL
jgi:tRNA 2-selenouridine synthase